MQTAAKADDELDNLNFAFRGLKSQLVVSVIPYVTQLAVAVQRGVVWFRGMVEHTNAVRTALWTLVGVVGILAAEWLVLNIEIFAVAALFAGLFLIVEDLVTMFRGGDSAAGRLIDKIYGVGASKRFVAAVKEEVSNLIGVFVSLGPVVTEVGGILSDIWVAARPLAEWFFKLVVDSQLEVFGLVKSFYSFMIGMWGGIAEAVGNALQKIDDLAPAWLKMLLGDKLGSVKTFGAKLEHIGAGMQEAVAPPTVSGTDVALMTRGERASSEPTVGTQNQTNQITVNVNGANKTNAEVGRVVGQNVKAVQKQLNATMGALRGR